MRVLSRIRQSRNRIAAAVSTALLAILAAGIGFAPAASASTTGAPSATHAAATVKPNEIKKYTAGPFNTIQECVANLDELMTNPDFVAGSCKKGADGKFYMIYWMQIPVCGGAPVAPTGVVIGKFGAPASC